jgi:hypothetical protein
VTGAIFVKRRRPIVLDDGTLDRKDTLIFLGVLVLLTTLSGLNSLPSRLFSYDTTQTWGNFIGTTALGFILSIPLILFILGLWLALSAMRRRVGIPMLAGEPSTSTSNDMLVTGLGLGGITYAMTHLDALIPRTGMPRAPTTMLNELLPLFAGISDIPANALMMVALAGIPLLVVAGLTQRWNLRALLVLAVVVMVGVLAWTSGPASDVDVDPAGVAMAIVGLAVVSTALVVWGSLSGWSWIVAALAFQGLGGLRNAAYGPVGQTRGAGALAVLVASALVAVIARQTAQKRGATEPSLTQV